MVKTSTPPSFPEAAPSSSQGKPLSAEIADNRTRIAQELSKEKKLPRTVSCEIFDLLAELGAHRGVLPSKEETFRLARLFCGSQINRWYLSRLSPARREKLVYSPKNKLESQIESTVEGLLAKGKKVSLNQVANMTTFYFKIPEGVSRALAKKIIHRVRERRRQFFSQKNLDRVHRKFNIPSADFIELADAGVVRPSTPDHVLESIGKTLQHYHHNSKRLRLSEI